MNERYSTRGFGRLKLEALKPVYSPSKRRSWYVLFKSHVKLHLKFKTMLDRTPFLRTSFLHLLIMDKFRTDSPLDINIIRLFFVEGWEHEKISEGLAHDQLGIVSRQRKLTGIPNEAKLALVMGLTK